MRFVAHEAGRIGQDGQAGCTAGLIGLGQAGRIKVGPNQPFGRTGLLDLGDQGQATGFLVAGQGTGKPTWRADRCDSCLDVTQACRHLSVRDIFAFVGGDFVKDIVHLGVDLRCLDQGMEGIFRLARVDDIGRHGNTITQRLDPVADQEGRRGIQ